MFAPHKHIWSITENDSGDIFRDGDVVENVQETYMIEFARGDAYRAGATSFENAFDPDNPEHAFYQSGLQMVLLAASEVRQGLARHRHGLDMTKEAGGDAGGNRAAPDVFEGEPLEMFVEPVLGSIDTASDEDRERMRLASDLPTLADASARLFMRDVPHTVPVVGYRLWIVVHQLHADANVGRIIFTRIRELNAAYMKRFNGQATSARGGGGGGDDAEAAPVSMSSYTGERSNRYGHSLGELDKWKRLHSFGLWATFCDMLIGIKRLRRPETFRRVISPKTALDANPAHPRYALSPLLYFQYPNARACADQIELSNYFVDGNFTRLHFPRPDCVVRVRPEDESIARFTAKMFPDVQARSMMVGSGGGSGGDSKKTRRQRAIEERFLMREQQRVGNRMMPMRSMLHRPLAFGEAGDIDESADSAVVERLDDDALAFMDDSVRSAAAVAVAAPAGAGIGSGGGGGGGVVNGGTAAGDIVTMLNSIPVEDQDGTITLYDYTALEREDFEDSTSLAAENLLSQTDTPNRSDFHRLRFEGANRRRYLRDAVAAAESTREQLRGIYLANQHDLMTRYEDLLTQPTSDCSQVGKRINQWFHARVDEDQAWLGAYEPLRDPDLSTFGNLIVRRMARIESMMFVTTSHVMILSMSFGTLDAYRHYFDLHWNAIMTGEHQAGKSFVVKLLQMLRINQTVEKIDEQTDRAGFIDTDHNDQIVFTEELKPDQFRDSKSGGNDNKEASLKEFLTSMYRTLKAFTTLSSGKRTQRVVYSQQIQSFLGCSNIPAYEFTRAIRSRMSCFDCVPPRRPDRHTADMQGVEKRLNYSRQAMRMRFVEEMCCEQYLHYHIEKLIAVHALTDVTTVSFDDIQQIFSRYLRDRCAIDVETRTIERAQFMVRQLVISARCELLFSSPRSPFYGRSFSIQQLKQLDALLYDDAEMACFALQMHSHEIVDNRRPHVMQLMRDEFVAPVVARILADVDGDIEMRMRSVYLMPNTRILRSRYGNDNDTGSMARARGGGASASFRSRTSSRARLSGTMASDAPLASSSSSSMHASATVPDDVEESMATKVFSPNHMYAYVRLPYRYDVVAQRVAAVSTASSISLTEDQVRHMMRDMSRQVIVSPCYRWNSATHEPELDPMRGSARIEALLYTYDSVFVARTLFETTDIIAEALEFCNSSLLRERRKYITCSTYSAETPHVLRTRVLEPGSGTRHSVIDYASQVTPSLVWGYAELANGDVRVDLDDGEQQLNYHYDELSRRERARALFLDPDVDGAEDGICSVVPFERYAREPFEPDEPGYDANDPGRLRYVVRHPCSVPEDLLPNAPRRLAELAAEQPPATTRKRADKRRRESSAPRNRDATKRRRGQAIRLAIL